MKVRLSEFIEELNILQGSIDDDVELEMYDEGLRVFNEKGSGMFSVDESTLFQKRHL